MASVKLVLAQLEGDEQTVLEAIRSFAAPVMVGTPIDLSGLGKVQDIPPVIETPAVLDFQKLPPEILAKAKRTPPRRAANPARPADDNSTNQRILALLEKKGMTSGEVIKALPDLTSGCIYSALNILRNRGAVRAVSKPDLVGKVNEIVRG